MTATLQPISAEDLPDIVAAAAEDNHRIVAPTHKIVKENEAGEPEIVGAVGFESIPLVTWWLHSEKGNARDSLTLLPELDAIMAERGRSWYFTLVGNQSNYRPHMERLGFDWAFDSSFYLRDILGETAQRQKALREARKQLA